MNVIPISKATGYQHSDPAATSGKELLVPIADRPLCHIRFDARRHARLALLPREALAMVRERLNAARFIEVILGGSGDPLADIEKTEDTLQLLKNDFIDLPLALATAGIHGGKYATRLAAAGLDRIDLAVNAVSEQTIARLYAWIRPGRKTIPLSRGAALLATEQRDCITACLAEGIEVRVRTTVYPGYNLDEMATIAASLDALGVKEMILIPCSPAADADKDAPLRPDNQQIHRACSLAQQHLARVRIQAPPCCEGQTETVADCQLPKPSRQRPNVAVASSNGMDIDTHLGHAQQLLIYGPREDGLACLLGTRPAPPPGGGSDRWQQLGDVVSDCFALLTASAGDKPRSVLSGTGIRVLITEENVEGTVDVLYGGGKKGKCKNNPTV